MKVACPCCGYRTLDGPLGSYCICPVCFWEDDDGQAGPWGGSNKVSLQVAQATFLELGACEREWLDEVRGPTPEEPRDPGWQPIAEQRASERARILAAIEAAFGCRVGQGMRIYEAELADSYGLESEHSEAVKHLSYQRYDEVPDDVVDHYSWVLSFFDPPGLQLHVATYMSHALRTDGWGGSTDFTIYAFECSTESLQDWHNQRFQGFDKAQCECVLAFLRYMADCEHADDVVARRALPYWEARVVG